MFRLGEGSNHHRTSRALLRQLPHSVRDLAIVARDLIDGTQTGNLERCAIECEDGQVVKCTVVDCEHSREAIDNIQPLGF